MDGLRSCKSQERGMGQEKKGTEGVGSNSSLVEKQQPTPSVFRFLSSETKTH